MNIEPMDMFFVPSDIGIAVLLHEASRLVVVRNALLLL